MVNRTLRICVAATFVILCVAVYFYYWGVNKKSRKESVVTPGNKYDLSLSALKGECDQIKVGMHLDEVDRLVKAINHRTKIDRSDGSGEVRYWISKTPAQLYVENDYCRVAHDDSMSVISVTWER